MATKRGKTWAARFSYRDSKGNRKSFFKGGFATEAEAEDLEKLIAKQYQDAKEEAERSKLIVGPMTFGQWAEKWKNSTLKINTRASGYATQEGRLRNYLIPILGDIALTDIRKSHGESFKLKLKSEGLAPKTRNHCVGMAKQILADAVDEELIARNPWQRLKLEEVAEEWDWYKPEEMARFLRSVKEHRRKWYLESALGCRAGLRAGEVAGLFVEDVDFKTGDVRIRRDVVRANVQQPKSRAGKRTIRVPADLLAELKKRRPHALLRPELVAVDDAGKEHRGHPFCLNAEGKIHRSLPKTLEKPIRYAAKKAEQVDGEQLRALTHRDLRHTYASHLRLLGIALEDIKAMLGHSTIQMTLRYAHISRDRFADAAKALESIEL